ncbi:unannotated protein [freshwater metagenome]|uniref:Unannotated protein n=1 Tax=freshwater metagenome TaxID=449393 RepID=A0A6J7VN09_9ZZZZ
MHRNHGGKGCNDCRHFIGQSNRRKRWSAVGFTVDVGEARHRFGNRCESGPISVWTSLTKARHASDHKFGIHRKQNFRFEPKRFEFPRTKILDKNIGGLEQLAQNRDSVFRFQIENNRALSTPNHLPEQRDVIGWISPSHVTNRVTSTWALDLDDVGAKVGQVSCATRPSQDRRDIDNTQIGKGWIGHD